MEETKLIEDYKNSKEFKDFKKRMKEFKHYTWEELAVFKKEGVEGEVCTCKVILYNSMTVECVMCGKVDREYAKKYAKRRLNNY